MKIKERKVFKRKGLVFAQFWSKFKNSTSGWSTTTRALFQIFFYRINQIFVDILAKNTKGWSGKSKILCIEQSGRAEKNTRKQKNSLSSPSKCKYFPNIFLSPGYSEIFAAVFSKSLFNWSPHFITSFSKPVRIPTESCENCSTAEMGFQLVPNIWKKVKLINIFTQIFLSEIISTTENGGQGTHFLRA